jgi:hypothetical protein
MFRLTENYLTKFYTFFEDLLPYKILVFFQWARTNDRYVNIMDGRKLKSM